jgi:hypothetical protein
MEMPKNNLVNRIKMSYTLGPLAGLGQILLFLVQLHVLMICDLLWPRAEVEVAENFDSRKYQASDNSFDDFGDHTFDPRKVQDPLQDGPLNMSERHR